MFRPNGPCVAWTSLLLVALAVRLVAAAAWERRVGSERFGFPDSYSYWKLARAIAQGEPFRHGSSDVFRTPGYPLLLAPLFLRHEPSHAAARWLGAGLGTLAVAAVGWLASQLFDRRAALLAAGMVALYPGAVALSIFVLSEAPFCPLIVAQVGCSVAAWRAVGPRDWLWSVGSGVLAGAATLMRPSWLLFVPFAAVAAVVLDRTHWRRHVRLTAALLLGLIVTMTPWWVRNYRVAGRFVPTTLQVGASLYDGWNPDATGASDMRFVPAITQAQRDADARATQSLVGTFEDRLDARHRDAALAWAREHPGRVVQLAAIKFVRIWNVWPNTHELRSLSLRLLTATGYVPLLAAGLWGAWRFGRTWPFALCWLPAVYLTGLHVIFVGSIRYREPAMQLLAVLAAGAVAERVARACEGERHGPASRDKISERPM